MAESFGQRLQERSADLGPLCVGIGTALLQTLTKRLSHGPLPAVH